MVQSQQYGRPAASSKSVIDVVGGTGGGGGSIPASAERALPAAAEPEDFSARENDIDGENVVFKTTGVKEDSEGVNELPTSPARCVTLNTFQ